MHQVPIAVGWSEAIYIQMHFYLSFLFFKNKLPSPIFLHFSIHFSSKPLPQIQDGVHVQNDLDRQLRYYREVELEHMVKEAKKLRETATDMNEALTEVEGYAAQLKNLAVEVRKL